MKSREYCGGLGQKFVIYVGYSFYCSAEINKWHCLEKLVRGCVTVG